MVTIQKPIKAPRVLAGYRPHAKSDGYVFDGYEAQRRINFFENVLTHVKGHQCGEPLKLQKWQRDFIATLFGWKEESTGFRRYRSTYLQIGRKAGKSTIAAGVALSCLHMDGEGGAEIYCAAGDRNQAGLVYGMAADMTRAAEALDEESKVRRSVKRILHERSNSFLVAVAANDGAIHGTNPHCVVMDELHVWRGRDLYDAFHTGMGARTQPLEVMITTAGWDEDSICFEIRELAGNVRDGIIDDPTFLPVIFEPPEGADWKRESTWKKANPNYGVSISKQYMKSECEKAKKNPAYENAFRRLLCNQWTRQSQRWLSMEDWKACPGTKQPIEPGGNVAGFDLSSTTDLTAWCIYDPVACRMRWRFWIPEDKAQELEQRDQVPYSMWKRQGFLETTPGRSIDYTYIIQAMASDIEEFGVYLVGYDPWHALQVRMQLEAETGVETVEVRQGYAKLTAPCKELERLLSAQELDHGNNPIAKWCASNVDIKPDVNGNIIPKKPGLSRKKIDGIAAALCAIQAALSQPPEVPGWYEQNDELEIA